MKETIEQFNNRIRIHIKNVNQELQKQLILYGQVVYHIDNKANCIVYDVNKVMELINKLENDNRRINE